MFRLLTLWQRSLKASPPRQHSVINFTCVAGRLIRATLALSPFIVEYPHSLLYKKDA